MAMGLLAISIVGLLFISAFTVLLQLRYARRNIPWIVHLVTFIAWCLAFSMCVILPVDMQNESKDALIIYWRLAYWVAFFFCWAVVPFVQEFYDSGGFTTGDKVKQSIRINLIFYLVAGLVLGSLVAWIAISTGITLSELPSFVICLSTTFGLTLFTLAVGYGLVELPRTIWYRADRAMRRSYLFFRLGALHTYAGEEQDKMQQTATLAKKLEREFTTAKNTEFAAYAAEVVRRCPKPECYKFLNISPTRPIEEVKVIDRIKVKRHHEITRADLIALNTLAIGHGRKLRISEADFTDLVAELEQNEIFSAYSSNNTSTVAVVPMNLQGNSFVRLWFLFRVRYGPIFLRIAAIILAICSVTVLWMELTLAVPTPLSPLALLTSAVGNRPLLMYFTMIIPVSFIVLCTFYSIFVLRISSFYHMHSGGRTGPVSILHNASFMLRLMPPMAYNFFLLTNVKENAFFEIIGAMKVIPVLGSKFHIYFPSVILLYSLATLFNWFARVQKALGIPRFEYKKGFEHENTKEGQIIYKREKRRREMEYSTSVATSSGKSDYQQHELLL